MRKLIGAVLGFTMVFTSACEAYHPALGVSPKEAVESTTGSVKLRLTNGSTVSLRAARIHGDSLYGEMFGHGHPLKTIELKEIQQVEVASFSPGKTVALVVCVGITLLVVMVASAAASMGDALGTLGSTY